MQLKPCFFASAFASLLFSNYITPVYAKEQYALLIGIGKYEHQPTLEGPPNDVALLKETLIKQWHFKPDHIQVLLDQQATKKDILNGFNQLEKTSHAGDEVFIYYSGHGISPSTPGVGQFNLPANSGALLPWETPSKEADPQGFKDSLIIPKKDLKEQALLKLNKNRQVFVALDTCYSANTMRGLGKHKQGADILDSRSPFTPEKVKYGDKDRTEDNDEYSYKENIILLSAASADEVARDIKEEHLPQFPTLSGRPQGVFSDALIGVLQCNIPADSNRDQRIDYSELTQAVRDYLKAKHQTQTPHLLPSLMDDSEHNITKRTVFGVQGCPKTTTPEPVTKLKVHLEAEAQKLQDAVSSMSHVVLTDAEQADLTVQVHNGAYRLLNGMHDVVTSETQHMTTEQLKNRIKQEAIVHKLSATQRQQKDFNINLELAGQRSGLIRYEGERFTLTAQSEKSAYWLLLDVQADGSVTVLYPISNAENALQPAPKAFKLPTNNPPIKVQPPFGIDHLLAFAFTEPPRWLPQFMGKTLELGNKDFDQLIQHLDTTHSSYSFIDLDMLTFAKSNHP